MRNQAFLKRKVEVYSYKEEISYRKERKGNKKRTVTDYTYTSHWCNAADVPESKFFTDKKFDLNKKTQLGDK